MECVLALIVLGSITFLMIYAATRAHRWARGWNIAYQGVAQRYNGNCSPATWLTRPAVRLHYGQTYAVLSTLTVGGRPVTQMLIQWPDRRFRLELVSRSWEIPFTMRSAAEIPLSGDAASRYWAQANDIQLGASWFSEGVLWQVRQLESFREPREIYIAVNRGGLTVRKPHHIKTFDDLDDFVRLSLELFDQAMLTQTIGISFVEEQSAQLIDEAHCQVCGEEIHGDMVFCMRCRTPHCRECWEYTGQCSTFACGETRYVRPMVASPIDPHPSPETDAAGGG